MRFVLTGGSGYIGRNLGFTLLHAGHQVSFLLHSDSSREQIADILTTFPDAADHVIFDGSIEQLSTLCSGADRLLHLAAFFSPRRDQATVERLITSNLGLSSLLFCAVADAAPQLPIIAASTFSAFDGDGVLHPANYYSATKAAVETIATAFPMPFTFLRFTDSYGPGDPRTKVFTLARDAILRGETMEFLAFREQAVNVMRVDDVVRAVLHAAALPSVTEAGTIATYDLSYPATETTLGHIAELLQAARPQASLRFLDKVPLTALPPQVTPLPGFEPKSEFDRDFVSSLFASEADLRASLVELARK